MMSSGLRVPIPEIPIPALAVPYAAPSAARTNPTHQPNLKLNQPQLCLIKCLWPTREDHLIYQPRRGQRELIRTGSLAGRGAWVTTTRPS